MALMAMLRNFQKEPRKSVGTKTRNMEQIKRIVEAFGNDSLAQDAHPVAAGARITRSRLAAAKKIETRRVSLDLRELMAIDKNLKPSVSNPRGESAIECPTGDAKVEIVRHETKRGLDSCDGSVEERRLRVSNFAARNVELPFSHSRAALFLPKSFRIVSELYKILKTTYEFNRSRDLSLVLAKYSESIERLFKRRLETAYLEQLLFIVGDALEFIPIRVRHNGEEVDTYNVKVAGHADVDKLLYDYFMGQYSAWLQEKGIEGVLRCIHPDFPKEGVEIPRAVLPQAGGVRQPGGLKKAPAADPKQEEACVGSKALAIEESVKEKASSIYERIKEKERKRREEFVSQKMAEENYLEKVNSIFDISQKRAIKLEELIFQLGGGMGCRARVLSCFSGAYKIRKIGGEEYVVKA